jgi:hypothetical protein
MTEAELRLARWQRALEDERAKGRIVSRLGRKAGTTLAPWSEEEARSVRLSNAQFGHFRARAAGAPSTTVDENSSSPSGDQEEESSSPPKGGFDGQQSVVAVPVSGSAGPSGPSSSPRKGGEKKLPVKGN